MSDELVLLCPCWDIMEAQSLRASFEARGVRVHIEGEHHRSMLGMFGSAIELRLMVPASHLALARELARELIPDLAGDDEDEEDEPAGFDTSPARRPPAEDLLDHPNDETEAEDDDEDDEERPRPKSVRLATLMAFTGLSCGFIHIYAGRTNAGLILLFAYAFGLFVLLGGNLGGSVVMGLVWLFDVAQGIALVKEHNRKLDALEKSDAPD
jgi:hypothetical protein